MQGKNKRCARSPRCVPFLVAETPDRPFRPVTTDGGFVVRKSCLQPLATPHAMGSRSFQRSFRVFFLFDWSSGRKHVFVLANLYSFWKAIDVDIGRGLITDTSPEWEEWRWALLCRVSRRVLYLPC